MLGISIYPEKTSLKENIEYLSLAAKYGFKRVFSCLLSVDKPKEEIINTFKEIISHANSLGMHVILDVDPNIFNKLGISYDDLSFFNELGASGIRLDLGFDGNKEALLTFNKYNLDIEINMSSGTKYLDNILSYCPNKSKLIGSHNFYPQKYTGLDYKHFIKCCLDYKKYNIKTAAFVTSKVGKIGPWPTMDGLCSLEMHRNLSISTQAKHLIMTGLIDDIIIGNAFASEEELKELSILFNGPIYLKVIPTISNSNIENVLLFDELHTNRGDINSYFLRSSVGRIKYNNENISINNANDKLVKGDVLICNNNLPHYRGELQLVKNSHYNDDKRKNVVAKVIDEEIFLIDLIQPWAKFKFIK